VGDLEHFFQTLLCKCIVGVADGCGGEGKGVGEKVTKGWRHRSATRMIVEGYSRPESTVSGEECAERRPSYGRRDWISEGIEMIR